MGSSKTAMLLMQRYNYLQLGLKVALVKPAVDTRDGAGITELSYLINKRFVRARKTDIILTSQTVGLTFRF